MVDFAREKREREIKIAKKAPKMVCIVGWLHASEPKKKRARAWESSLIV